MCVGGGRQASRTLRSVQVLCGTLALRKVKLETSSAVSGAEGAEGQVNHSLISANTRSARSQTEMFCGEAVPWVSAQKFLKLKAVCSFPLV